MRATSTCVTVWACALVHLFADAVAGSTPKNFRETELSASCSADVQYKPAHAD